MHWNHEIKNDGMLEDLDMTETIMPCFDRFPREGNLIGRLLAGYGELELELCSASGSSAMI
jgi:hypothetical protein